MNNSAPIPDGSFYDLSHTGIEWVDFLIDVTVLALVVLGVLSTAWAVKIKPMLLSINSKIAQASEDAKQTKKEVKNSHAINLRDDIDGKHIETNQNLKKLSDTSQANLDQLAKILLKHGDLLEIMMQSQLRHDKEFSRINDSLIYERQAMRSLEKQLDDHVYEKKDFGERLRNLEDNRPKD